MERMKAVFSSTNSGGLRWGTGGVIGCRDDGEGIINL